MESSMKHLIIAGQAWKATLSSLCTVLITGRYIEGWLRKGERQLDYFVYHRFHWIMLLSQMSGYNMVVFHNVFSRLGYLSRGFCKRCPETVSQSILIVTHLQMPIGENVFFVLVSVSWHEAIVWQCVLVNFVCQRFKWSQKAERKSQTMWIILRCIGDLHVKSYIMSVLKTLKL